MICKTAKRNGYRRGHSPSLPRFTLGKPSRRETRDLTSHIREYIDEADHKLARLVARNFAIARSCFCGALPVKIDPKLDKLGRKAMGILPLLDSFADFMWSVNPRPDMCDA